MIKLAESGARSGDHYHRPDSWLLQDDSLALKSDGTVVFWGDNNFGQANVPAGLSGVTAISAGGYHSLALEPGAATTLVVSGIPSPDVAGAAHSVIVTAKDAYGNTATGYLGTVQFTSTDPDAILPANYLFTAADKGVHAFTAAVTFKTAGTEAVRARDTLTATITGLETGVVVAPAAASVLLVTGIASPRVAGTAGTVTVTAKDSYGNTATGYTGTVHFTSTDAKALLPADRAFVAADAGVHAFSITLRTAGTQAIRARDTLTATITGLQSNIVVTP